MILSYTLLKNCGEESWLKSGGNFIFLAVFQKTKYPLSKLSEGKPPCFSLGETPLGNESLPTTKTSMFNLRIE